MHLVQKQQVHAVHTDDLIYLVKRQVNQRFDDPWGQKSNFAESASGLTQLHLNANIIILNRSMIVNWLQSNANKSISHDLFHLFRTHTVYIHVCVQVMFDGGNVDLLFENGSVVNSKR